MVKIKVPASSANMGAGFDTLGVALSLYNRMEITEIETGLEIFSRNSVNYIPKDENNLIYRSMKMVFDRVGYTPTGIRIFQDSQIPMTRGLGSSSSCIIGGMLGANILSGRQLNYTDILNLATKIEGHPDNVAPALFGGFCISGTDNESAVTKSIKIDPVMRFAVMIPDYFVATRKSREVLPKTVSLEDASFNIQRASMFQAAITSGDMELLKYAAQDRLHQPYRKCYIDGMEEVFEKTYELGARATYLSGSGPTILSIIDKNYSQFNEGMKKFFKENSHKWDCMILSVDNVGAVTCETNI